MLHITDIKEILGEDASYLLDYTCEQIPRELLHVPHGNFFTEIFEKSDRSDAVIANLNRMAAHGRLSGTGYLSILPVDQGVEHGAGVSFAKNISYFDPEAIIQLAIDGGCSAVASTLGVLGILAKEYATEIPFVVKINHNDLLRYPNDYDQILFAHVEQAAAMGAAAVGATIYFGSQESKRQIVEISRAFKRAHELGLATIAWCYLRSDGFKVDGVDYHEAADLTGQANHLAATIEADIVKQKLPTKLGGYKAINEKTSFGKYDPIVEKTLLTDHPIDLCRYQVANGYMGRIGLINSGGPSFGDADLREAVYAAVVNKRAGGMGLIMGRKAFQRDEKSGIAILHAVQDVYACNDITIA